MARKLLLLALLVVFGSGLSGCYIYEDGHHHHGEYYGHSHDEDHERHHDQR